MAPKTETATAAPTNECKCGCGQTVTRNFAQGHDQKLVSTLAENIVNGKPPTGNGALSQAKAKRPVEERIELVAEMLTKNISEGISAKFEKAALRKVETNKAKADRETAKATRKGTDKSATPKTPRKARAAKAPAVPANVSETDEKVDTKLNAETAAIKAHATAEQVEAAGTEDGYTFGQPIKIKVRNRVIDARVAGLNQSGKVTAAIYNGAKGVERRVENPIVVAE